jgi:NAD(P)-dependent dehydrogenase (short-subunit alcohol dehydrogenase family)
MLPEKVCLVTGAAERIGRATSIEMARPGPAGVVLADLDETSGRELRRSSRTPLARPCSCVTTFAR